MLSDMESLCNGNTTHDAVDVHTEFRTRRKPCSIRKWLSDRSLAVSKANTVVDGIKKVSRRDSWWSTIISNIYARPRRYHRVNDGRKRNSLIEFMVHARMIFKLFCCSFHFYEFFYGRGLPILF
jgi:hypothetical protein